ncbi:hypothetical protein F383_32791 [Gossypium arboreum]|uniref:Uncharacterized protein n=1 Tax=Gossypium arboreum TaxID=29729 RepID=A0A0B0PPJ9_GOSAR|nr:hypothetical protein F383_32791 [Gossypium arboreum]
MNYNLQQYIHIAKCIISLIHILTSYFIIV